MQWLRERVIAAEKDPGTSPGSQRGRPALNGGLAGRWLRGRAIELVRISPHGIAAGGSCQASMAVHPVRFAREKPDTKGEP